MACHAVSDARGRPRPHHRWLAYAAPYATTDTVSTRTLSDSALSALVGFARDRRLTYGGTGSISPPCPMSGSNTKKHHVVPQFVLRRFTEPGTDLLHVFDLQRRASYRANVKTTAAQEHYYRIPAEITAEFLAYVRAHPTDGVADELTPETLSLTYEPGLGAIEDAAAPVMARIIATESLRDLSLAERTALSVFLAVQTVRTPSTRRETATVHAQLRALVTDHARRAGHDPAQVLASMGADTPRAASAAYTALSLLETAPSLAPLFAEKPWALLRTPRATPFVIGDNPVTRVSHQPLDVQQVRGTLGLRSVGIEMAMPLSPQLCLVILCPTVAASFATSAPQIVRLRRVGLTLPWAEWMSTGITAIANALATGDAADVASEVVADHNARQVYDAERLVMSCSQDFAFVAPLFTQQEVPR